VRQSSRNTERVDYAALNSARVIRATALTTDLATVTVASFRTSIRQAIAGDNMQAALAAARSEFDQLHDKRVWDAMEPRSVTNSHRDVAIAMHMFLKEKFTAEGVFSSLKARLVADGSRQHPSTFDETSSPTVQQSTLMTLLNIMAFEDLESDACDITGAFLYADIRDDNEIICFLRPELASLYIKLYPHLRGHITSDGKIYVRLRKYLYGLKQAGLEFFNLLTHVFTTKLSFKASQSDPCLFIQETEHTKIYAVIHVDDIFFISARKSVINNAIKELRKYFTCTVQANELSYLGLHITRDRSNRTVHISQPKLTADAVKQANIQLNKKANTPATPELFDESKPEPLEPHPRQLFHSITMKCLYIARFTRPESLATCTYLATRCHAPTRGDYAKLVRLLTYWHNTPTHGLVFGKAGTTPILRVYVDASHGVHSDGKGVGGIIASLGSAPILAKSYKLKHVTLSSTESELSATSEAVAHIIYLRRLLEEIGYKQSLPTAVFQDNQSTLIMHKTGSGNHKRTKHMHVRLGFVKEHVELGNIRLIYCPTGDMLADMLTKGLPAELFAQLIEKIYIRQSTY
jgi:hypothetical protein